MEEFLMESWEKIVKKNLKVSIPGQWKHPGKNPRCQKYRWSHPGRNFYRNQRKTPEESQCRNPGNNPKEIDEGKLEEKSPKESWEKPIKDCRKESRKKISEGRDSFLEQINEGISEGIPKGSPKEILVGIQGENPGRVLQKFPDGICIENNPWKPRKKSLRNQEMANGEIPEKSRMGVLGFFSKHGSYTL